MVVLTLLFFAVLFVAAVSGRVADSRDYADWRPSDGGQRRSPR
jgi:hypothetical protein